MQQAHPERQRCKGGLSLRLCELADAKRLLLLQLEEVETHIQTMQHEFNSLHNLDAPTSTFSNEILAMVFETGMRLEADTSLLPHFGSLVSHVCHRWRMVALGTPRLWTKIRWKEPYTKLEIERVATFLSRTRLAPVKIYLKPSSYLIDLPLDFLRLTRQHVRHCRHISIRDTPVDYLATVLDNLFCNAVPILESIYLCPSDDYHEILVLNPDLFLFGAPCLVTADLSLIQLSTFSSWLPVLQNITSLRLRNIKMNTADEDACASFRSALMAMPALNLLDLHVYGAQTKSFGLHSVFLHSIKFLRICTVRQRDLEGLLNSIYARSLTTLYLPWAYFQETRLAGEENLGSHFPLLQHLILESNTPISPNVGAIASRFPQIKCLTCRIVSWNATFSKIGKILDAISLAVSRSNENHQALPWPELKTIAVPDLPETNDAIQLHYKLFNLRNSSYYIQKLKLSMSSFFQPTENLECLQSIIELEEYKFDWPVIFKQ